MKAVYIWQNENWPQFTWDNGKLINLLSEVRYLQGHIGGLAGSLGFEAQNNTSLDMMTEDVLRSSEIEGVLLNADRVRSSLARHLGIETGGLPEPDHYTEGVVQVMIDAVHNNSTPLSDDRLFGWHAALFPNGRSGLYKITVAAYRVGEEPMQVVSGAFGKEKVHYEAPPSSAVPGMMQDLLSWIEEDKSTDAVMKAAIAHFWFVAIHPFDDGNGRLARTITDMLLTRADGMNQRYYSMSAEILKDRNNYYQVLETTSKGNLDITSWLEWFLNTMKKAIISSEASIGRVLEKSRFWETHRSVPMNERQIKIVNRLWDGFDGKLNTSKWAKMTKTSQATALRDISDLVEKDILRRSDEGGRSTSYELNI